MGIIAIVGRPNVGKSSIFNRMLGRREAIVDDFPGVTRDRLYGGVEHDGKRFYVVDTGGIMGELRDPFPDIAEKMLVQVRHAVAESDGVIFVLSAKDGLAPMDREIASELRRSGREVIVAVNKTDDPNDLETAYEAASLGFDRVIDVSAAHARGISDLVEMAASLVEDDTAEDESDTVPVAIVGRPNVGKSSLLNALAGAERSLVSDIPGTTRDVVDTTVEHEGMRVRFLDTAGLRRRSRIRDDIEYYSGVRTYQAIDRCRVAIVMLDARELVTDQDKRLVGAVLERGKGLIVAVNKWDLVPNSPKAGDKMQALLRDEMPFATHAPKLFLSALSGRGIPRIWDKIAEVDENRRRRISTAELNRLAREVLVFERMPGDGRGRYLKVKYCTQADGAPPAFIFFVNDAKLVTRPFERRLDNILRGMADFGGVPLKLFFRENERPDERSSKNA